VTIPKTLTTVVYIREVG